MELRAGYKKTEIGVIPEDWEVLTLRDVLESYELGGNYPNATTPSPFPLMKMGNVSRGEFDLAKIEFVSSGIPHEGHRLKQGDVIFNTRNTLDLVGKIAIWRDEIPLAYFNSNLMRLHFDPTEISSNEYANLTLNTEATLSRLRAMATGTTSVAAIYTRDLLELPIIVPPLSEQEAIAKALSDVDALIATLARLVAKKRDLRQGAMQRLLTGETRLPGFTSAWMQRRVKEFGQIVTGGTPKTNTASYWGGEYPWITPTDIGSSRDLYDSERTITLSGLQSINALPENSILVTCIASIGKNAILRKSGACNQQINAIIPNTESSPDFLYYLFEFRKNVLIGNSGVTATRILSKKAFMDLEFFVPNRLEQDAIAAVLSHMDAEVSALKTRLQKTRALKQAMMQALLTGRVRLPVRRDAAKQAKEAAHA